MSLPTPKILETMDYTYQGQPFVNVPASTGIDLGPLDYTYQAQPFAGNQESFFVSISETLNLTEDYTVFVFYWMSVTDSLDISEEVTMIKDILPIDPIENSISISEYVEVFKDALDILPIDNTINLTEDLELFTDFYHLSVADDIQLQDPAILPFSIYIDEVVDISEDLSVIHLPSEVDVYETLNISENLDFTLPISRSTVSVIELSDVPYGQATLNGIFVSDSVDCSDEITTTYQYYEFLAFSSIDISEQLSPEFFHNPDVYESVIFADYVTDISNPVLGGIDVFTLINLSENYGNTSQLPPISVSDTVDISDVVTESQATLGNISKYELLFIFENAIEPYRFYSVSVRDNISISESVTRAIQISLYTVDTIQLSENVAYSQLYEMVAIDSVAISENITMESFQFSPVPGRRRPVAKIGWDS
jgi:hypothetical protein